MAVPQPFRVLSILLIMSSIAACTLPGGTADSPKAAATSTQPAPQTVGQCSNPLQPVIVGAAWTYAISGITTGTFTRSITDVRADGFTDQTTHQGGAATTTEWKCEAGALTALSPAEGLSALFQTEGMNFGLQTTSASGVTIPAIVRPNDSWSQSFTIEGTQPVAGQEAQGKGDFTYVCTAGDSETVIVPAGPFDAVRVGCQINGTITVTVAGLEVPTEIASAATIWYARDVGMVKTENEITSIGHSTIELTAYTIQ